MTIASADILDQPIISPNWFTREADVEQAYAAVLRLCEIVSHWGTVTAEILPGRNITSQADIQSFVKTHGGMFFHGTSTCKLSLFCQIPSIPAIAVSAESTN